MGRLFLLGAVGWFVAMSCGGDVPAGCPAGGKECMLGPNMACVAADDPKYGCVSSTCLSCGALSNARNVKVYGCDAAQGGCFALECLQGYRHCSEDRPSRCETHIDANVANCGECGKACPSVAPNTAPLCVRGQCATSCLAGYFDCDQQMDNGCECAAPRQCDGHVCAP